MCVSAVEKKSREATETRFYSNTIAKFGVRDSISIIPPLRSNLVVDECTLHVYIYIYIKHKILVEDSKTFSLFFPGSTRNRSSSPYRQREVSSGSVRSGGSGGPQVNLGYGTNAWADSRRASSSVSQVISAHSFIGRIATPTRHSRNFFLGQTR